LLGRRARATFVFRALRIGNVDPDLRNDSAMRDGRAMTLEALNGLDVASAERELCSCCGARRWVEQMASRRPFRDFDALVHDADKIWLSLEPVDWLEAFARHPRIGERAFSGEPGADRHATPGDRSIAWSVREQAGVDEASAATRERLASANREYEERFGFIYVVCAQGMSGDELLAVAERRLKNSRDEELVTAAEEQRKITHLRLAKLVS
jgi:OHCU decarboxylase